jgi:hypothetical protein
MTYAGCREIILDADLPGSLKVELRHRGFAVQNLRGLKLHKLKDPPMIEGLCASKDPASIVLVTSDDRMPGAHGDKITEHGLTVATLEGAWMRYGYTTQDHWRRDIIHRWAHKMAVQVDKEVRRYTVNGSTPWKMRYKKRT